MERITGQSRRDSLIETLVNTGAGFIIGIFLNLFVLPALLGIPSDVMSIDLAIIISVLYGGTSIIRTFILRRAFNKNRWRFWE